MPHFPPPPPLPPKVRPFQRVPPAIFPPLLGLLGLGIAWRRGADAFGIPPGAVEIFLGGAALLCIAALASYAAKLRLRPGALADDLGTLPGRTGLAAATMCAMLLAAALVRYAPGPAGAILVLALGAHVVLAAAVLAQLVWRREAVGPVTAGLQLVFVGVIVAPAALLPLGAVAPVVALSWYAIAASLVICARTFGPLLTGREPPPLRPLHAIHLAPPALVATAAFGAGRPGLALAMLAWATLILLILLWRTRWMIAAGFSGFWSAFTFPAASYAGAWLAYWQTDGGEAARIAGGLALVGATLLVPPIAVRVMRMWADGSLAARTNAAIA